LKKVIHTPKRSDFYFLQQEPFVFLNKDEETKNSIPYKGYCIDLIDEIRNLIEFDYEIYAVDEFGNMDEQVLQSSTYHTINLGLFSGFIFLNLD